MTNQLKRKRQTISLADKQTIIEASKTKPKTADLVKHFDNKYVYTTIDTILKNKDKILQAIEDGAGEKRAKLKGAKYPELEEALLNWLKDVRSENVSVDGPLLKEKALKLAELLGIVDFKASEGWLTKFKQRHDIVFKQAQGEAGDINLEKVDDWRQTVLRDKLAGFSEDDVFNVDETGLFWKLLPSKTMTFKGEKCTTGKRSKERITVLVGSNMSGTEKVPLLVIGKSAKPRSFKNARIPVDYKANKKAWMTGDLFEDWVKRWDRKLGSQNRKILLFVDNCPAHRKLNLENITLQFFLPNATAEVQPMDQGIIQNLKVNYRRLFLRRRIAFIDAKKEFQFNLLDSINLLNFAWKKVKPETLKNCFRKAGFHAQLAINDVVENDEVEVEQLWEQLKAHGEAEATTTVADFLQIDQNLATTGTRTLEEIVESVQKIEQSIEIESEDELVDVEIKPVSRQEAYHGFDCLRRYVETNAEDPELVKMCHKFEDFLYQEQMKSLVQTSITQFMTVKKPDQSKITQFLG